jgi:uncharacterized Fe-S center protein
MASKVFFSPAEATKLQETLHERAKRVFDAAGLADVFRRGDLVAVKTHLGEKGGYRFLRPQFIRVIVEKIKENGGVPFIVDTTGIGIMSSRQNAVDQLELAKINGFTWETLGAPVIIGDGLKGYHGVEIGSEGSRRVEIAQIIAEADAMISVAHFKGHPRTGIGGAIKNIAIGCATKRGKASIHLEKKPYVKPNLCNGCGVCVSFCPASAISMVNGKAVINQDKCIWGCGCWSICPAKAISGWGEMHVKTNAEFSVRIAEALKTIVEYFKGKIGYVNYIVDVTPHCDCFNWSDLPLVPDIGVVASKDPVAIDACSLDLVNKTPPIPTGPARYMLKGEVDKFSTLGRYTPMSFLVEPYGGPAHVELLQACVKLGIGSVEYELIEVS